jgi:rhodanese-related sulfurtransferase
MKEPARTLLEVLLVGAVALGAGLGANALNRDGLSLKRDYFRTATPATASEAARTSTDPGAPVAPTTPASVTAHESPVPGHTAAGPTGAESASAPTSAAPLATPTTGAGDAGGAASAEAPDPVTEAASQRLRAEGLQVLTHAEAQALFEDPAYAAGAYVFVDARGDDAYREGHIPGAVQFDRYHPERHVADVTAACAGVLQVIVYCNGKNCEDSELAAQDLPALGIDPRIVHVYVGGWTEWSAAKLPIEKGARGGGGG